MEAEREAQLLQLKEYYDRKAKALHGKVQDMIVASNRSALSPAVPPAPNTALEAMVLNVGANRGS